MFSKSAIKLVSNLLLLPVFGSELSRSRNWSSKIDSKSPEKYATRIMIVTQIVNIHPMKTKHATDTKNWGSISALPVSTKMTPLMVWEPITPQWNMNIDTLSSPSTLLIAGKTEKTIKSQSWNMIKWRALTFHKLVPM